jgi:hypothetical protein
VVSGAAGPILIRDEVAGADSERKVLAEWSDSDLRAKAARSLQSLSRHMKLRISRRLRCLRPPFL